MAWILPPPVNSVLTKIVPWLPWRRPRASRMPLAKTSTLKPAGTLRLGSLSAAVGIGGDGTGASLAPGPASGRPMAQNGTSSSCCCATTASLKPASRNAAVGTASKAVVKNLAVMTLPRVDVL